MPTYAVRTKRSEKTNKLKEERIELSKLLQKELAKMSKRGSNADEITEALIIRAKEGDVRAYEMIRDTIGQKPTDSTRVELEAPTFINDLK